MSFGERHRTVAKKVANSKHDDFDNYSAKGGRGFMDNLQETINMANEGDVDAMMKMVSHCAGGKDKAGYINWLKKACGQRTSLFDPYSWGDL